MHLTSTRVATVPGMSAHQSSRYQTANVTKSKRKKYSSHFRDTRLRSWAVVSGLVSGTVISIYANINNQNW